jgi:hypothetical protein
MPLEDKTMLVRVRHEISKFSIDSTRMDIKVINQVAYLGGRVRRIRALGAPSNLKKTMEEIRECLEKLPGINDVVIDVAID